jgi:Arc/MetJ-type ribon-helix-helix transcriptional regulator
MGMMNYHTAMPMTKVAVTIDASLLRELDALVQQAVFPNRSRAVQAALEDKLRLLKRSRLARECAKLDPATEVALAEEGMTSDGTAWPEY